MDDKMVAIVKDAKINELIELEKETIAILKKMDKRQVEDWTEFKKAKKRQAWVERAGLAVVCLGLYYMPQEIKLYLNSLYQFLQAGMEWMR